MSRVKALFGGVVVKLTTLTVGAAYVALSHRRSSGAARLETGGTLRMAIVAHVYYPELIGEIIDCLEAMPADTDLIVTVPENLVGAADIALAGVTRSRVVPVVNRGRDVAPFLGLLARGELEPYDAVLKIHTKRSPHLRDGDIRRKLLLSMLAGSPRRIAEVRALFEKPKTGIVGWRAAWRRSEAFWMANRTRVVGLAAAMDTPVACAFFEGSMFWVRPSALAPMRGLGLTTEEFEAEAGQLDGALHHAIERTFTLSAMAAGYDVLDLSGRPLCEGRAARSVEAQQIDA